MAVCYHSDTPDSTGKELPGRLQRLNAKLRQPAPIVPRPTRLLYASCIDGRGVIGDIDRGGNLHDLVVLKPGTFSGDWTQIVGIGGDRILYYISDDGRGVIGSLPSANNLRKNAGTRGQPRSRRP